MPEIKITVGLADREKAELEERFAAALADPDCAYGPDEFDDWAGEVLMDAWRRRAKLPSGVVQ